MDYAKHLAVRPLYGFNTVAEITSRIIGVTINQWHQIVIGILFADVIISALQKHKLITIATPKLNRAELSYLKL